MTQIAHNFDFIQNLGVKNTQNFRNTMKNGKSRFQYHLMKVEGLLSEAQKQESPILWLYSNDLRTPMFMLESLSKMYAKFHNEKAFDILKDDFKSIEDGLGAIDFYLTYSKEFAENDKIPMSVKSFLEVKVQEKIGFLNDLLEKENWLNGQKIANLNEVFDKINWLKEQEEIEEIEQFYHKQIKKIYQFMEESNMPFVHIEEEVHELRRKLRWLSIYPQALRGVVQLKEIEGTNKKLSAYLSDAIINSLFNKLPVSETLNNHLYLEKNHFFALNWIIAEFGKIKDIGLKINVLQESLQAVLKLTEIDSLHESYELLGANYPKMEDLLRQASEIAKRFFEDKILDSLVLEISVE